MGIFDNVKGARPSRGGRFFPVGNFTVMVNRCAKDDSRNKGEFMAIECVVVESDTEELRPKGQAAEIIMANWDGAGSMLIDFGMVVCEELTGQTCDPGDVDKASLEDLCSAKQPVAGRFFKLETFKKNGKEFTNYNWQAIKDPKEKKRVTELAKSLAIAVTERDAKKRGGEKTEDQDIEY